MAAQIEATGYIQADCVYTLPAMKKQFGWGTSALRTARRRGLKVKRVGRCGYVLGSDVIAFIAAQGQSNAQA